MDFVNSVLDFMRNIGPQAIMPVFMILLGLIVRVQFGKLVRAALTVAIGFIGMNLMIGVLASSLAGPAQAMAENFGLNLETLDVGWAAIAGFSWASTLVPLVFLLTVGINMGMIALGWTKTMNVDVWNYHVYMFAAQIVYLQTNNVALALAAAAITIVTSLLIADWAYPLTKDFLPGISFPHAFTVYWIPLGMLMNKIYDKIPGLRDLKADPEAIQAKFGFAGEPMILGFVLGILIGALARLDGQSIVVLGLNMSAVMVLLPRMVGLLMEGIGVIANGVSEFAQKSKLLKGKPILIGCDGGLLFSRPAVLAMAMVMIPLTLLIAFLLPGNRVFPLGDLAVLGGLWQWSVITAKENVVRGIITAIICCVGTLLIATSLAPIVTQMALSSGYVFPEGVKSIVGLANGNFIVPWALWKLTALFGF